MEEPRVNAKGTTEEIKQMLGTLYAYIFRHTAVQVHLGNIRGKFPYIL